MGSCTSCVRHIVCLSTLLALFASPASSLTIEQIAVTGDVAPDTGGATWETFEPIVMNNAGEVAFTATLAQGGSVDASNDIGTWSGAPNGLALVQRQGSPAPGGGTWSFVSNPPAVLNDAGQVAFHASTLSPFGSGIYHEGSGTLAAVALDGQQAAGAPVGQNHDGPFFQPVFNDAGQVAFQGGLQDGGVTTADDRAVWAGGPTGPLTMVARKGDVATGAGGATWLGFPGVRINSAGDVSFRAPLSDGGEGLWAGAASGVQLVARDGSAAAGTAGDFASFGSPDYNDLGQVAFHAGLEVGVGGVTSDDDRGVWAGAPGALGLVAREGDAAPDTGGRFFDSFSGVLTNDVGDVVFGGDLRDGVGLTDGTGLFLDDGVAIDKVVASGDTAIGTSLGTGDATFVDFSDWALNDAGGVAFEAVLGGLAQGVTTENNDSLWVMHPGGVLEMVVREGMLWELGLGDFALVDSIDFFGGSDSLGRAWNDQGWLVFGLKFEDGREGIYRVTPEPGTGLLLATGLVGLAARRRSAGR